MRLAQILKILILFLIIISIILIFPFLKNNFNGNVLGFNFQHKLVSSTPIFNRQLKRVSTSPILAPTSNMKPPTFTPTPLHIFSPTNTPTPPIEQTKNQAVSFSATWQIQSIDAMKDTKDAICGQRNVNWINNWLNKAVELGANYVAISTPYDNPNCGDALSYTRTWVNTIRSHGLHVWHRHMPLAFEGIYNVQKENSSNFLDLIKNYITSNPDLFQPGDIFTPIPEPQNGGIEGVTYCQNNICQFISALEFNRWLRNAMTTANDAFNNIGKGGQLKVGYFGFDGFVVWGDNNPDWHGILEDATVSQMGNITIDHYPELVHETMSEGLSQLSKKYPHTPIVIGEWGSVTGGNITQQIQDDMEAVKNDSNIIGFNYWQFGPSGSGEQLIDNSFNNLPGFSAVQNFYK